MSTKYRLFRRTSLLAGLACAAGCAHKPAKVQRVEAQTQVDLSGRWNDTDAHLTGEALTYECFAAAWLPAFAEREGRRPAVRVASIVNQTDEHIDAQVFIKNIERAMINSGKVQVLVQSGRESDAVAAEVARQGAHPEPRPGAAAVPAAAELGADFVGTVRVAAVTDAIEGREVRLYKVNVELLDVRTGEKVWIGDYEVKKLIGQGRWKL